MPIEVTGDPTWVSTITTPANGDPVDGPGWEEAMQDVADQIAFLNLRTPYAAYSFTDTTSPASPAPLTSVINIGGFTLEETNTAIHVPSAGWYELVVTGRAASSATGASETITMTPELGNDVDGYNDLFPTDLNSFGAVRFSNSAIPQVAVGGSGVFEVTDPATEFVRILHGNTAAGLHIRVQIRKIANP